MNALFDSLLKVALTSHISILDFWEMTYGEIVYTIRANNETEINSLKELAAMNYHLANLIGLSVARLTDKDAKYPSLYEAFPTLFEEEIEEQEEVEIVNNDWILIKDRLLSYASAHNNKRGDRNDT